MDLSKAHFVGGTAGLIAGALMTVAVFQIGRGWGGSPQPVTVPFLREQIEAAISLDPSFCSQNEAAAEMPSPEEAQAAFRKARGEAFPQVTITLGQCHKDTIGPGVACMTRIVWGPNGRPSERLVGFAKSPDGWVAVLY